MIKAVCFDMFSTLVDPHVEMVSLEYEHTGLTREEWGKAFWDKEISDKRGLGVYKTGEEIMEAVVKRLPIELTEDQIEKSMAGIRTRLKTALTVIDEEILNTVKEVKDMGLKIGLVSNADVFDTENWPVSPLAPSFDDVIFSCDVGLAKPDRRIYELSLKNLGGIKPEEAVFVGDGGGNEHFGAKSLGFTTILTEYIYRRPPELRAEIIKNADYRVIRFKEVANIVRSLM